MVPLIDRQLVVLSGKGGVGRTTVAAALAQAAAARGKRVLIAQTNAVERLGRMLGRPGPIGSEVIEVAPRIAAVNMTPRESLHQYALMVLRYETVYKALFDNRIVRGFLSAIPGIDAYAMLGKTWWHTTETEGLPSKGSRVPPRLRYDLVILDGPASGHSTAMLKIPKAIIDAVPAGPLLRDARLISALLADPQRTAFVIVTLPAELPAGETVELARAARVELGLPLGPVIVNAVPPARLATEPVASLLDRLGGAADDKLLARTLAMAAGQRAHVETANEVRAALARDPGLPMVALPWLPSTDLGPREIEQLSAALVASPEVVAR
jgi:anion-transporting  ArsA/GET3 family ATPase